MRSEQGEKWQPFQINKIVALLMAVDSGSTMFRLHRMSNLQSNELKTNSTTDGAMAKRTKILVMPGDSIF